MTNILEHLESYGICDINFSEYENWASQILDEKTIDKIIKYQTPLWEGRATQADLQKFYDFSAQPKIEGVIHSLKTDAFRSSAEFIEGRLNSAVNILDVGCSIGYLTTFYALQNENRKLIGWDNSSKSIKRAKYHASKLGIKNIDFNVKDIRHYKKDNSFDTIICSQVLYNIPDLEKAIENISTSLTPSGKVICVEAIGDAKSAASFDEKFKSCGFFLEEFDYCFLMGGNGLEAYSGLVFNKSGQSITVDYEERFDEVREKLNSINNVDVNDF